MKDSNSSPRVSGLQEHGNEIDSTSGISLDVDRGTACDTSSTSSKPMTPHRRITRHLNRTLHVITSTLSNQDTIVSTGSSNVFQPKRSSRAAAARASSYSSGATSAHAIQAGNSPTWQSRPSSSRQGYSTSPNDRSTPSLWYENIRSPLKASKQVFRGMLADLQDRTSSAFSGRSARGPSDADDLNLYDNVYTAGGRFSSQNRSEELDGTVIHRLELSSLPTEEEDDEIFTGPTEGAVLPNMLAISGDRLSRDTIARQSDRISRDDHTRPGTIPKSQSDGNISVFGFDPKIQFNNFVLDTKI